MEFSWQLGWAWGGFQDVFTHMPGALEESRKLEPLSLFVLLALLHMISPERLLNFFPGGLGILVAVVQATKLFMDLPWKS